MFASCAQKLEKLDALPQTTLHHLRAAGHLANDVADLVPAEIEPLVEILERIVNLLMAQMRIVQRRDLDAAFVHQFGICGVQPTILHGLFVEERSRIGRGERDLNSMRIDAIGETYCL